MSVSTEQYIALSTAAYGSFNQADEGQTISALLQKIPDSDKPQSAQLHDTLSNWILVDSQDLANGFAAAAFKNPTTGEIVFAFRGTDQWLDGWAPGADVTGANLAIVFQDTVDALPTQFVSAASFVYAILNNPSYAGATYSFTGHSLGGSLASYMTFVTNTDTIAGVGTAETFNAPGIVGLLPGVVDPREYDLLVKDHVNEADIVGQFRHSQQLGTTVYHTSNLAGHNEANTLAILNSLLVLQSSSTSVLDKVAALENSAEVMIKSVKTYHDMSDMFAGGTMTNTAPGSHVQDLATFAGGLANVTGYVSDGVIIAADGGRFAIVTIGNTAGGLLYYGADGVVTFINTSGQLVSQLSYHGANGVEKFIDTSSYMLGGIGYFVISGIEEFFDTTPGGVYYGQSGSDELVGSDGDDIMYGYGGDDFLYGGQGSDILVGGVGVDNLSGGTGVDTYVFNRGDGKDVVLDEYSASRVQFGENITPGDIAVRRWQPSIWSSEFHTEISIIGTRDRLTFVEDSEITEFVFANGTTWSQTDINNKMTLDAVATIQADTLGGFGGKSNDINAGNGNDILYGADEYADQLIGGRGDDIFDAFGGNDTMAGTEGNDTYIFKRGYGQDEISLSNLNSTASADLDTIQMGTGIAPADIIISRPPLGSTLSKYGLEFAIAGTQDKITFIDFYSDDRNPLATIRVTFSDGTIWDEQYILAHAPAASMNGSGGADTIYGYAYENDTIYGNDGADMINGQGGFDTLHGGGGNDTLQAYGILDGGTGNDTLVGMLNDLHEPDPNTFVFGAGYGQDVITEGGRGGIVRFKTDIDPQDIIVTRLGSAPDDIVITIAGTSDSLVIKNVTHFPELPSLQFEFLQNNTTWNYADIASRIGKVEITGTAGDDQLYGVAYGSHLQGDDGNDVLQGDSGADIIEGGNGADYLLGKAGDDILDGGAGNDLLAGAEGSDTYIFGRGYGQDTIHEYLSSSDLNKVTFTADIEPADLLLERPAQTNDLSITIIDTGEKLIVTNYFASPTSTPVQQFVFADTTVWDRAYVDVILPPAMQTIHGDANDNTLMGSTGSDTIIGYAGNDMFMGMEGDDVLEGGSGNDVYMYIPSHGNDTIIDTEGSADMLMVGPTELDMMFERVSDDLRVTFASTGEHITIQSWYDSTDNQIEVLQAGLFYGGGSMLQNTQVDQLIQAMASYSSNNNGISWSQALQSHPQDVQTVLSQYWTAPTA